MAKRWSDLSTTQRRLMVVTGLVEGVLKLAMLRDLRSRPAEQIRGSKRLWILSTLVNTAGVLPIVYFTIGRVKNAPDLSEMTAHLP
jgi:hypothetical protein